MAQIDRWKHLEFDYSSGRGGTRTLTGSNPHGILSPERLPIPPLGLRIGSSQDTNRPQTLQEESANKTFLRILTIENSIGLTTTWTFSGYEKKTP